MGMLIVLGQDICYFQSEYQRSIAILGHENENKISLIIFALETSLNNSTGVENRG